MSKVISIQGYELHIHGGEPMIQDLELAERLEFSRPRDIRKLIKRLLDSGAINENQVRATVSRLTNGSNSTTYYLSEKAVLKVITKSETEKADQITDEMIDVFIDYRNGTQKPASISEIDWSDTQQIAGLMLQSLQKVQEQQQLIAQKDEKIAKDAPKVSFYDKFASEDGLYGLQNAARILKQGPNLFSRMLKQEGYLFYQGSALVPKIKYINQGIFELKSTIVDDKARYRTWLTPKGLQYFAKKLNVEIEEAA